MFGKIKIVFMSILFILIGEKIHATEKVIVAVPVENEIIAVDGRLDESVWSVIPPINDFIQREPIENISPTEKTEAYICYDEKYLYVGIKAYCKDPSTIKSILTRRDEWSPSDWIYVYIDSYNDNRTAFQFGLNPLGVQRDTRWSDDEQFDQNWNAVWDGKASYFSGGWSVEFKIPFRELRFENATSQAWGFQVQRKIAYNNEDDYWTYWSKDEHGFVSHFGELKNLNNLQQQKQIQIIPYTTGQMNYSELYKNVVHPESYDVLNTVGLDLKYGITNNLTLDVSINPDFGQVEADPAELNLSAFESYFGEKRPFFIEGANIFNYALGIGDGDQSQNSLFYTRRIGRSPHYSAYWGDYGDGYISEPSSTRILGAAKLSGKTSNGLSVGILDAVTAEETAIILYENGPEYEQVIEPLTNYFVNRVQKDYRDGRTTIGGIITAVNRKIEDGHLDWLHTDAYSGGVDFSHLFWDNSYMLLGGLSLSHIMGSSDAILNTQTSPNHYFQRVDAEHLGVDSTATHLTGFSQNAAIFKVSGDWRWGFGQWIFSPEFEANDLGYHRDVDKQAQFIWFSRQENDPGEYIRNDQTNLSVWHGTNFGYEAHPMGGNLNLNLTFNNYWSFGTGINIHGPGIHTTALRGGPAIKTDGKYSLWFNIGSDFRKDVSFNLNGHGGQNKMGTHWEGISTHLNWRPAMNFSVGFSVNFNHQLDTWANWSGYTPTYDEQNEKNEYILSHFEQKTLSTTFRLDWTIKPNMSLQYYGSPFVTAGTYNRFIKVVNPKGDSYDNRFYSFSDDEMFFNEDEGIWEIDEGSDGNLNYIIPNLDFNYRQFNSNLVLRWEYKSGSTLYLVWSQGVTDFIEMGDFDFKDDIKDLFKAEPENIFLIKFNYLFNL